jgi:hypothetical protein
MTLEAVFGGMRLKTHENQKKAEYYLFNWQINELRRISRETRRPPSEVLRSVLSEALKREEQA